MMTARRSQRLHKPRLAPTIAVDHPLKTNGLTTFVRVSYVVPPHGDR
jgi:hypothetical protein